MQVKLKRHWFGPDAKLYRGGANTPGLTEIPDFYRKLLPKDAVVQGEGKSTEAAEEQAPGMPIEEDAATALDHGKAESKAVQKLLDAAQGRLKTSK